jgi:hypothetical protein
MTQALAVIDQQALAPYTPRSVDQALTMAATLGKAAGISAEEAFLKMATGAEHGIPASTALRQIDIIPGPGSTKQIGMRAQLMVALCLRAKGVCEHFRFVKGDSKSATYTAKRVGGEEDSETYTIEQAKQAGLIKSGGAWEKDPASQLIARASSRLARRVFPDVLGGVYAAEEADEIAAPAVAHVEPLAPVRATPAVVAAPVPPSKSESDWLAEIAACLDEPALNATRDAMAAHFGKGKTPKALREAWAARLEAVKATTHVDENGEVVTAERQPGEEG